MRQANYSRGKRSYSSRPRSRQSSNNRSRGPKKQNIHPDRFINHEIAQAEVESYTPIHSFDQFSLCDQLVCNINDLNYRQPSAIQDQAIPLAMKGQDVVGLANTGTGKTAAFLLPIINRMQSGRRPGTALIIAPTRELAQQIDEDFRRFSRGMKLYSALCVGGSNIGEQIRSLSRGPQLIVGTPGRLKDLIARKQLHLYNVETLVLDEADRMLDMGFINDIKEIAGELPRDRQTLCFSATITSAVGKIIQDFMNQPVEVSVQVNQTSDHIYQDVVKFVDNSHKKELLTGMLEKDEFEKVIVFGETKFGVQRLADSLTSEGIPAVAIHGNKSQSQREKALRLFKNHQAKVLVATDVAARGLDIPNVSHVINYDTPQTYEDYVHRIGRTGRAGKTGQALTLIPERSSYRSAR